MGRCGELVPLKYVETLELIMHTILMGATNVDNDL